MLGSSRTQASNAPPRTRTRTARRSGGEGSIPIPVPPFSSLPRKKETSAAGITSRVGSFADVGCHGPGRAPPAPAPAASPSPAPAPVILPSSPLRSTRRPYPTEICDGRWWRPMAPGGGVRNFGDVSSAQYVPHLRSVPIRPPPKLIQRAAIQASLFFPFRSTLIMFYFFCFINFGIDFSVMEDANNSFATAYSGERLSTVCMMIHCFSAR